MFTFMNVQNMNVNNVTANVKNKVSQLSHFFLHPACCSSLSSAHLRVRGIFAPSIVRVLQLRPLTSTLLVACSIVDLGFEAPSVYTVIVKREERVMK